MEEEEKKLLELREILWETQWCSLVTLSYNNPNNFREGHIHSFSFILAINGFKNFFVKRTTVEGIHPYFHLLTDKHVNLEEEKLSKLWDIIVGETVENGVSIRRIKHSDGMVRTLLLDFEDYGTSWDLEFHQNEATSQKKQKKRYLL